MKIGVVFPQFEIGADPGAVREFARRAEELGYAYILAFDHVLGVSHEDRDRPVAGPYTEVDEFHEPLTLLAHLSAVTTTIGLATGILVLPQRQTAVVAKQAAEIAILSQGRLRLGLGVGWNHVEFAALGESFAGRGRRLEEQIHVMRELWAKPLVQFRGNWHDIDRAALAPRPAQEIPIYLGGMSEVAFERAARLADGFCFTRAPVPGVPDGPEWTRALVEAGARVRRHVARAGRAAESFRLEGRTNVGLPRESWTGEVEAFRSGGFDFLTLNTMRAGLHSAEEHVRALETYAEVVGLDRATGEARGSGGTG